MGEFWSEFLNHFRQPRLEPSPNRMLLDSDATFHFDFNHRFEAKSGALGRRLRIEGLKPDVALILNQSGLATYLAKDSP